MDTVFAGDGIAVDVEFDVAAVVAVKNEEEAEASAVSIDVPRNMRRVFWKQKL